jgi:CBS-domain-containing membrane protein
MNDHTISRKISLNNVLEKLNYLGNDLTLFVIDENYKVIGSVTDGDIRRGLLRGLDLSSKVEETMQLNFKFLKINCIDIDIIKEFKNQGIILLPLVDNEMRLKRIINLNIFHSVLPVDVAIMAGGEGQRLRPLTDNTPKPVMKINKKSDKTMDKPAVKKSVILEDKDDNDDDAVPIEEDQPEEMNKKSHAEMVADIEKVFKSGSQGASGFASASGSQGAQKVNDFNYYEDTFKVIDTILHQHNSRELVNHQHASYKQFIEKDIGDIIRQFNTRKLFNLPEAAIALLIYCLLPRKKEQIIKEGGKEFL